MLMSLMRDVERFIRLLRHADAASSYAARRACAMICLARRVREREKRRRYATRYVVRSNVSTAFSPDFAPTTFTPRTRRPLYAVFHARFAFSCRCQNISADVTLRRTPRRCCCAMPPTLRFEYATRYG